VVGNTKRCALNTRLSFVAEPFQESPALRDSQCVCCFVLLTLALHTPEERLPSGVLKEEFGRMIFEKQSSLGDR